MADCHPIPSHVKIQDITGQSFKRWTVIEYHGLDRRSNALWLCRRDDGLFRIRRSDAIQLRNRLSRREACELMSNPVQREILKDKLKADTTVSPSNCWEWNKYRDKDGYGRTTIGGHKFGVHIVSYLIFVGEITPGFLVCHRCDNPPCCNPDHLFSGTSLDNSRDMVSKGRHNRRIDIP